MGAIAEVAKAYIPISWDALSQDSRYGTVLLQGRVERAKYQVLGTASPVEADEDDLTPDMREFIAKKAIVLLIPAAIEFWIDRPISKSTTGTQEVVAYESRVGGLRELYKRLIAEIAQEEILIDPPAATRGGFPAVSDGQNENLISVNPYLFPPAFNLEGTDNG